MISFPIGLHIGGDLELGELPVTLNSMPSGNFAGLAGSPGPSELADDIAATSDS